MNKKNVWMALTIEGDSLNREIATAYLDEKSIGILNLNNSTIIYFKEINKKEIENVLRLNTKINIFNWDFIEKEDWNDSWKPFFKKKIINNIVEIIPSWDKVALNSDKIIIKIDPGMAFGTGHHETTEMMIKAILEFHKKGMSILDLGTGSGILSILAYKLKSKNILAVDNDPEIKSNYNNNMKLNNVKTDLEIKDCLSIKESYANLVLANISKPILVKFLQKFKNKGNVIIISGFLKTDFKDILKIINQKKYKIIKELSKKEWLCIVIK